MCEPLVDALRTKQQLGYAVGLSSRSTQGVLGLMISVVSATHTPADVERRAAGFVAAHLDSLEKMPRDEYDSNMSAAVANRLLADKSIDDECQRFWFEIEARQHRFARAEEEAAAMRATSQAELVKWAKTALLSVDARRLAVIVRPQPPSAAPNAVEGDNAAAAASGGGREDEVVVDPKAFAARLPLHLRDERPLPEVAAEVARDEAIRLTPYLA